MGPAEHHLHALGLAQGEPDDGDDHAPPTGEPSGDARAAPPIVGLIRKAALDDRPRRSLSYRHTDPYEMALDEASGLEYEIRACKYCDTAFSFKGGTTSAALRHLRLAHPSEFYGAAGPPPPKAPPLPHQQQQHQPPHQQREQSQPELRRDHPAEQEDESSCERSEGEQFPEAPPHPEQDQHQQHEPVDPHAEETGESGEATDAGEHEPPVAVAAEEQHETPPTPPRVRYHKRRRHDDEQHHHTMQMNVNQLAISHFIAHYKQVLPPSKRLAFIKHLAYNDREAAMYNVLDEELRLEFLVQFSGLPAVARGI